MSTLTDKELLTLTFDQILHPDFVVKQTRGLTIENNLKFDKNTKDGKKKQKIIEAKEKDSTKNLILEVLAEGKVEHITTGLLSDSSSVKSLSNNNDNNNDDNNDGSGNSDKVTERLSRELAGQALSTNVFSNLANRRTALMDNLYKAFDNRYKSVSSSVLRKNKFKDKTHSVKATSIQTSVRSLISLLKTTSTLNEKSCLSILESFKVTLDQVKARKFEQSSKLPAPDLTDEVLDEAHKALADLATMKDVSIELKEKALELLIGLATSAHSLPFFLTAIKIMLKDDLNITHLNVLSNLHKLSSQKIESYIELPSEETYETKTNVAELSHSERIALATDGTYIYTHTKLGLLKIGTGKNGTSPGMTYGLKEGYKPYDLSDLIVMDDKLYFRSNNIAPLAFIVLDTKTLEEIGTIAEDGTGTYKTADNSHFHFCVGKKKQKKKKVDEDEPQDEPEDVQDDVEENLDDEKDEKEKEKKKKKSKKVARAPFTSDGRFLYFAEAEPQHGLKRQDLNKLKVRVLDPRSKIPLKQVYDVSLRFGEKQKTNVLKCKGVNLGNPSHLNLSGSITMECWFKTKLTGGYQSLFYHGDASYRTYVFVERYGISIGSNSATGSSSLYASERVQEDKWTHIACVCDADAKTWTLYINGNNVQQKPAQQGITANAADWYVGSSDGVRSQYPFTGQIAEARIWKRPLSQDEVIAGMTAQVDGDSDGLVGYWPLDEGFGLTVADVTTYRNRGTLVKGEWQLGKRPFELKKDIKEDKDDDQKVVDQDLKEIQDQKAKKKKEQEGELDYVLFPNNITEKLIVLANGEHLVVFYPQSIASKMFRGIQKGAVQIFSLETGRMLQELEHSYAHEAISGTMVPGGLGIYMFVVSKGVGMVHQFLSNPPTVKSKWRLDVLKAELSDKELNFEGFPTNSMFAKIFELPPVEEEDLEIDEEHRYDPESIDIHTTLYTILSKIEEDSRSVNFVNTVKIPNILRHQLAVNLCPGTFKSLMELVETLSQEYYDLEGVPYKPSSPKKPLDEKTYNRELKMYAFLVSLKLLTINVMHAVGWNADLKSCGFEADEVKETRSVESFLDKDEELAAQARRKANRRIIERKPKEIGEKLQGRVVRILNKLILESPKKGISGFVADKVTKEVSKILSLGMKIFYGKASSRVAILAEIIKGDVVESGKHDPLRVMLMNQYFSSQSASENIITVLPVLEQYFYKQEGGKKLTEKEESMSMIMENTLDYIYQHVRVIVKDVVNGKAVEKDCQRFVSEKKKLIDFVSRAIICVTAKAKGDTSKYGFTFFHLISLFKVCEKLFEDLMPVLEKTTDENKQVVSNLLSATLGNVLLPLISALWSTELESSYALKLLKELQRLIALMDKFCYLLPEVIEEEKKIRSGGAKRKVVERTATVETSHPPKNNTWKLVTIPGATKILVTIDPKSFTGNLTLTFWADKTRSKHLGYYSTPQKTIHMNCDSFWIEQSQAYGEVWGYKVTAKAYVEEQKLKLVWLLDLVRTVSLLAGKACGVLLRGQEEAKEEGLCNSWIESQLLSEGIESTKKQENEEEKLFKELEEKSQFTPQTKKKDEKEEEKKIDIQQKFSSPLLDQSVQFQAKFAKSGIRVNQFPVPRTVREMVNNSVNLTFAVMIKHNHLSDDIAEYLKSDENKPSSLMVAVWKKTLELRSWIVKKYQLSRSAAKKTDKKKEDEKAEETEDDEESDNEEETVPEKSREEVYAEVCNQITDRCKFLLHVAPVPVAKDKEESTIAITEQNTLIAAYRANKKGVELRSTTRKSRTSALWKILLTFFDSEVSFDALQIAITERKKRAHLRTLGFRWMYKILQSITLASSKREALNSLIPALSWNDSESNSGAAPDLWTRLQPCGTKLRKGLRDEFEKLYRYLLSVLIDVEGSGSQLLQTVLHSFSLKYNKEDFSLIINIGIFPALKKILGYEKKHRKKPEEKKEREEKTEPKTKKQLEEEKAEQKEAENSRLAYETSSWSLLDLLTTIMTKQKVKKGLIENQKEPVYEILLDQLVKIAQDQAAKFAKQDETVGFAPELPENLREKKESAFGHHVGTVTAFGMRTSTETLKGIDDMDVASLEFFNIRVLNLINNVCNGEEGIERVKGSKGISSLCKLVKVGSPRTQIVALRILRKIIESAHAPSLKDLQEAFGKDPILDWFLQEIGKRQGASVFASLALDKGAMEDKKLTQELESLNYKNFYSKEGIFASAEQLMFIRALAKCGNGWETAIGKKLQEGLSKLASSSAKLMSYIKDQPQTETVGVNTSVPAKQREEFTKLEKWNDFFFTVGCLSVYGGFSDTIRVGSRVYDTEKNRQGVVVHRDFSSDNGKVSVVDDGEIEVSERDIKTIKSISDIPFDASSFKGIDVEDLLKQITVIMKIESERKIARVAKKAKKVEKIKSAVKKKKKTTEIRGEKFDVNMATSALLLLNAKAVRVLHSLSGHSENILKESFNSLNKLVYDVAQSHTSLSDDGYVPIELLEDQIQCLKIELSKRARAPAQVSAVLAFEDSAPHFRIKKPKIQFDAEFTRVGAALERGQLVSGELSYIKLNQEPTQERCNGKIVLLDTYGKLNERVKQVSKLSPIAIVLSLHSASSKLEGLNKKAEAKEEKNVVVAANEALMRQYNIQGQSYDLENLRTAMEQRQQAGNQAMNVIEQNEQLEEEKQRRIRKIDQSSKHKKYTKLPVICINDETSKTLRKILGVSEEDDPGLLNSSLLSEELVKKGYKKEFTHRALEKSDFNVKKAAKWLDDNKEWLDYSNEEVLADIGYDQNTNEFREYTYKEDAIQFRKAWKQFLLDSPDEKSFKFVESLSKTQNHADGRWYKNLLSRSTEDIVLELMQSQLYLIVLYSRRMLVGLFLQNPHYFAKERNQLKAILHFGFTQKNYPGCELTPLKYVKYSEGKVFKKRLLELLTKDKASKELMKGILLEDSNALLASCINKRSSQATRSVTFEVEARDTKETETCTYELNYPEFSAMKVHMEVGDVCKQNGWNVEVGFWEDKERTKRIKHMSVTTSDQIIIPKNKCYYTVYSYNYYQNNQHKISCAFKVSEITTVRKLDADVLTGDVGDVLTCMDMLLGIDQSIPVETMILLMRSLSRVSDGTLAQRIGRLLIKTFNMIASNTPEELKKTFGIDKELVKVRALKAIKTFDDLEKLESSEDEEKDDDEDEKKEEKEDDKKDEKPTDKKEEKPEDKKDEKPEDKKDEKPEDKKDAKPEDKKDAKPETLEEKEVLTKEEEDADAIAMFITAFYRTYDFIRQSLLCNWAKTRVPGPHLQTLMELILSSMKLVNVESELKFENGVEQHIIDQHNENREGNRRVTFIDIHTSTVYRSDVITASNQSNRSMYVGDVCVKGGRWYWEVKLAGNCGYANIGWVQREYKRNSAWENLGYDYQGRSWTFSGPSPAYATRGMASTPTPIPGQEAGQQGYQQWKMGTVLGFMIDCDKREMQCLIDGVSTGILFQDFDIGKGVFPCVFPGYNCTFKINFGREKFAFDPNKKIKDKTKHYLPLENVDVKASGWFKAYKHSSSVTSTIYKNEPLSEKILEDVFSSETTLTPAHVKLEVVQAQKPPGVKSVDANNEPSKMINDDDSPPSNQWAVQNGYNTNMKTNFHATLQPRAKNMEIIPKKLSIECWRSQGEVWGLVFLSDRKPDFDSFSWTDNWEQAQYASWLQTKKKSGKPWKAHEPVGSFKGQYSVSCILDVPRKAKFITFKISSRYQLIQVVNVKATCLFASHPLGNYLGKPEQLKLKAKEFKERLIESAEKINGKKAWTKKMDSSLASLAQAYCDRSGYEVTKLDTVMFKPGPDLMMQYKEFEKLPLELLQARFGIMKYLNKMVTPLLDYVDIRLYSTSALKYEQSLHDGANEIKTTEDKIERVLNSTIDRASLSYMAHRLKDLYFMNTKKSVLDALLLMSKHTSGYSCGAISINRAKASFAKENLKKDPNGEKSVFGQMFHQIKLVKQENWRIGRKSQLFSVKFLGEGSIDAGGPYREALSNACGDLMSNVTPLFIPCPNSKNSVGLGREKYVVNPSCTSSLHLDMYEVIGGLMGVSIRTGDLLELDLPSMVWKKLLGIKVEKDDLEAIDKLCIQALDYLEKIDEKEFEEGSEDVFVTHLSNGQEVELVKGGADRPVKYEDLKEFVNAILEKRLSESDLQIQAMKKGLNAVVSDDMLTLFSPYDLELMVCGTPEINIELLKKHTVYKNVSSSSSLIKNFWKALESFDTKERRLFLRFVWGRSRLPFAGNDWTQHFTINALNVPDDKLPISHTCFFSLELPRYRSYKKLRQKLLFAIINCQAIDVDFDPDQEQTLSFWDN